MYQKKFTKGSDKKIAGIAAGIGEYFNIDPLLIRAGFLALTVCGCGAGVILYVILAVIMPEKNQSNPDNHTSNKDYINIDDYQNSGSSSAEKNQPETSTDTSSPNSNKMNATDKPEKSNSSIVAHTVIGLLMIYFGLYFLLKHIIPFFKTEIFLPSLIICAGIMIIFLPFVRKKKDRPV